MKTVALSRSALISVLLASIVAPTLVGCVGTTDNEARESDSAISTTRKAAEVPLCEHHEWQDGEFKHEQPLDPASDEEILAFLAEDDSAPPTTPTAPGGDMPATPARDTDSLFTPDAGVGVDAQYAWILKILWVGGKYGVKYGPKIGKAVTNFFTGYKYFKLVGQAGKLAIRAHKLGLGAARNRFIVYMLKKSALGAAELATGITTAKAAYDELAKEIAAAEKRGECVDEDKKTLEQLGQKIKEAEETQKRMEKLIEELKKEKSGDATEAPEPPARMEGESDDAYDLRLIKWLREVEKDK